MDSENQLQIIVQQSGLESTKSQYILDKFQSYFQIAADWEVKARAIIVTDESQKSEMQMARTGRLFLREKRIAIEKSRKELKEQALREGKAIDGIANVLKALIEPIENYLDQQEHYVEIKAKAEAEAVRVEAERIAEADRIAKEKAALEEQAKIKLENERLKKEAEAREAQLVEERKKHDEAQRKAQAEKKAIEEKHLKAREAIELKAKQEREQAALQEHIKVEAQRAEKEKLEKLLASQIVCPNCNHKFDRGA